MTDSPLLFDLDGTLVDTLPDILASANHLRRSFGLSEASADMVRSWIGDGAAVLVKRCLAELGDVAPLWERALRTWVEHHEEQCTLLVRPYPLVVETLARWRAERRPMAVVTNKPARFSARILDHLGLAEHLPVVISGDTLPARKPDPAPLREALRRLGAPPRAGTMVGDGVQDLRAGKAAGLRTVAVLFGFRAEAELRAEGADEYWSAFGVPA